MTNLNESDTSFFTVPVRITPVSVFVDAWDTETPIEYPRVQMPLSVVQQIDDGADQVIAEARVNLGATDPNTVILAITKVLEVPADSDFFATYKV